MLPSSHPPAKIAVQAARDQGWNVSNPGEAEVARELAALGYTPADVETQFRLGPYRIDFAIPAEQIAIEADGWVHTTKQVRARDRERDRQLKAWGWVVVRVSTDDARAQLRRHVPLRPRIQDYGATLRQVDYIFKAYLDRLQRRGITSPEVQLERLRDMLLAASKTIRDAAP